MGFDRLSASVALACVVVVLLPLVARGQQVSVVNSKVTTTYCGSLKGCMRSPTGCETPNCDYLATWKKSDVSGFMDFELMGKTIGWVAFGLSLDSLMGDDSVMHCALNNSNSNTASVGYSYNIKDGSARYNTIPPASEYNTTLLNTSASYVDGQIHCRFTRSIEKDGTRVYPLNSQYYLLLVTGPTVNGAITQHTTNPTISPRKVDVTTSLNDESPGTSVDPTAGPSGNDSGNSVTDKAGNKVTFEPSADGKSVKFVMERKLGSANGWLSLGFSTDRTMEKDSVLDCIRKANGQNVAQSSYNVYHSNSPTNTPNVGITTSSATFQDGILRCEIVRPMSGVNDSQVFPLNESYYLLMAYGTVIGDAKQPHQASDVWISSSKVTVSKIGGPITGGSGGKRDIRMKRAHGILMITAWVLLVSTSIIIARYYKTAWPGKKLCTTDVWFSLHRFLMLLALCCTIAGFIMIFVVNKGKLSTYPEGSPTYFWVHAPLGIVVMILVIINPLMAAFRCHPNTKYRPIFNWLHWLVGTSCHVVALITVFFGAKIGELNPTDHICHMAIFWILIGFVGFHVFVEIILSIDKCISEARSKRSFQVQYEMSKPGEVPRVLEPSVSSCSLIFRYLVLVVYFLFVLTLWLAMVILIGLGRL